MGRFVPILFTLLLLLPGCFHQSGGGSDDSVDIPDTDDPPDDPPVIGCADGFTPFSNESVFAYEGFEAVENDDPQNTIFKRWEGGHNNSYEIVTDYVRSGSKAFRIDITPNETTQGGDDRPVKNRHPSHVKEVIATPGQEIVVGDWLTCFRMSSLLPRHGIHSCSLNIL